MIWANDSRYEGDWVDDKRHGRGTYHFANGDKCEGDWWDNRLLGMGKGWKDGREWKCYLKRNVIQFTD